MRWFNDTSEDEKATEEFLAARIENVMQFEKFKAKAKEALSNFPAFADWAKPKKELCIAGRAGDSARRAAGAAGRTGRMTSERFARTIRLGRQ